MAGLRPLHDAAPGCRPCPPPWPARSRYASLASALTPNLAARARDVPLGDVSLFHALTVPASVALGVTAVFLARRRHRAFQLACVLLALLGALHVLKGLDVEEAALSWAGAGLLWWGRDAFVAVPARLSWRAAAGFVIVAAVRDRRRVVPPSRAPAHDDELRLIPLGMQLASLGAILAAALALFRPHRPPRELPGPVARRAAMHWCAATATTRWLLQAPPRQALLFGTDGRAFLGYRMAAGALLVSGDPVGARDALGSVVARTVELAERHGLALGVVGAGEDMLELWQEPACARSTSATRRSSTLRAHPRRAARCASCASRSPASSARATRSPCATTRTSTRPSCASSRRSRALAGRRAERGFSMAMEGCAATTRRARCSWWRATRRARRAASCTSCPPTAAPRCRWASCARRRDTPNGLTEFLVVRAVQELRERGVEELSLNFCAFGRWLREPATWRQRLAARILHPLDGLFQIESLLHFNAKFATRWAPRHVAFRGWAALPRVAVAALEAEGQLPRPAVPGALRRAA